MRPLRRADAYRLAGPADAILIHSKLFQGPDEILAFARANGAAPVHPW